MGNVESAAISCTSGVEKVKEDILSVVTSSADLTGLVTSSEDDIETLRSIHMARSPSAENFTDSERTIAPIGANGGPGAFLLEQSTERSQASSSKGSYHKGHSKKFLKKFRHKTHKVAHAVSHALHSAGQAAGHAFQCVEDFMFPHAPHFGTVSSSHHPHSIIPKVRGGVLLQDCHTDDEHRQTVREIVERIRPLYGAEGLEAIGLEYRKVDYGMLNGNITGQESDRIENDNVNVLETVPEDGIPDPNSFIAEKTYGLESDIRLFHTESNTMVTEENRKLFIADGDMYDAVARLCQEAVQEEMIEVGDLEWVTICDAGNNSEPIRALVSADITLDDSKLDSRPTLLIATGKGKVRAGVFSRRFLMVSGMECCTALPIVREAVKREMNIVMVDPNVHGDRLGMITFEKSMARIFRRWEQPSEQHPVNPPLTKRDLFVLSHSQSGAQLARYLLDKSEHYVPHIRAIAFTDSTHNIQWARENENLHKFLQSPKCVYFRCSKQATNNKDAMAPLQSAGEPVETDSFWQHRFGTIATRCAGTTEHSLTNWFARTHIWEHFDSYLSSLSSSFNK